MDLSRIVQGFKGSIRITSEFKGSKNIKKMFKPTFSGGFFCGAPGISRALEGGLCRGGLARFARFLWEFLGSKL